MYQYDYTGNFKKVLNTTLLAPTTLLQFLGSTGWNLRNTLRTSDANLRFCVTKVKDG
jgi:hypothetical protein